MVIGYKCDGCGETFLYDDYNVDWKVLSEARKHAKNHNATSSISPFHDPLK